MSSFDDVLSPDFDFENQEILKIESVEEVVNFEKGFYLEDKAVHILNLLSTNNKNIDLEKFKNYWKRKVDNILNIEEVSIQNYNKNVFPIISCKKKVTEYDPDDFINMTYKYDENNIIPESVKTWILNRHAILGKNGTYSQYVDNKCYVVLNPFTNDVGEEIKSTDCYLNNCTDVARIVGPTLNYNGDRIQTIGYVNKVNNDEFEVFNLIDYKKAILDIKIGDPIYFFEQKKIKSTITNIVNNVYSFKINQITKVFDLNNIILNTGFIYPKTWKQKMVSKFDFLKSNIHINGPDNIAFITGNDLVKSLEGIETIDKITKTYPKILDNISNNIELSLYFKSFKKEKTNISLTKKKGLPRKYSSLIKLIQKKKSKVDFIDLSKNILAFVNTIKIKEDASLKLIAKKPSSSFTYNGEKVFFNVKDMMSDSNIPRKAKAFLVDYEHSYKHAKKIFPYNYKIYELGPTSINNTLYWDIIKEVVIEDDKNVESLKNTNISLLEVKEMLQGQIQRPIETFFKNKRKPMTYSTFKSYINYQGADDFENNLVPEFGVKMDEMIIDEENVLDSDDNNEVIHLLANIVGIKLPKAQESYISKASSFPSLIKIEETEKNDKKAIVKIINSLFICFSLFAIFAQVALPETIISQKFDIIYTYPIKTNDDTYLLLKHFLNVIKSNLFRHNCFINIFSSEATRKLFDSTINLKKTCDKILEERHFLKLILNSTEMKINVYDETFNKIFLNKYPLWPTFKPVKNCLNCNLKATQFRLPGSIKYLKLNKKKYNKLEIPNSKIVQKKQNVVGIYKKENASFNAFDMIKTNINMPINISSSEKEWNEFSEIVEDMAKSCICEDILTDISKCDNLKATNILNNLLSYEIKDLIGKIAYHYQIKDERMFPTHIEFLKNKFYTETSENINLFTENAKHIVNSIFVPPNLPFDDDLKYVLMFFIFYIISKFPTSCFIYDEIKTIIKRKFRILTMTKDIAELSYKQNREQRKQQYMQMYKGMDAEIRKLNKQAVDMKLISREDLLENVNIHVDELEMRLNNDNDNYDVNEED